VIFSEANNGGVYADSYAASFTAQTTYAPADDEGGLLFEWNFGDGNTTSSVDLYTTTHTYSGVGGPYDVSLTVTTSDALLTSTATRADYIQIVPTVVAPLTQAQLRALLDAINTSNVLGVLDGATWVQESAPNTSVWAVTVANAAWTTGLDAFVIENGDALTQVANVAACQAAAGSSYDSLSGSTLTLYVHPTGSGNPGNNGNSYRWWVA
jgi:hypothetical protein